MLAVKTGYKRMTEAYSQISGYDRPHVYVFVTDKKISALESVFKNFRIRPENTLGYVWTQAVFVKTICVFTNFRIRVDDALVSRKLMRKPQDL